MKLIIICVSLSVYLLAVQAQDLLQGPGKISDGAPYHCEVLVHRPGQAGHSFSGSIISRKHVLTVAHPVVNQIRTVVGVGSNRKGQLIYYLAEAVYTHPQYTTATIPEYIPSTMYIHSMAVVVLEQSLTFNSFIQPVPLPPMGIQAPLIMEEGRIEFFDRATGVLKITYERVVAEAHDEIVDGSIIFGHLEHNRDEYCLTKELGAGFIVRSFGVDTIMGINQLDIPCSFGYNSPYTRVTAGRDWIYEQFGI